MDRIKTIREHLQQALQPEHIEIVDDSHQHIGHASAGGAGHFSVTVIANAFAEQNAVQRHRLVYAALSDLMPDEIHAVSIKAYTPEERPSTNND